MTAKQTYEEQMELGLEVMELVEEGLESATPAGLAMGLATAISAITYAQGSTQAGASAKTFAESGLMHGEEGLVVELADGTELQITIQVTDRPSR